MTYDITGVFEEIELSLIKSMRINMQRHIKEEYEENINWTQWQTEMLAGLSQYKEQNKDVLKNYMGKVNKEIDKAIREAYATGESQQEIDLLKAIKRGYKPPKDGNKANLDASFFRVNQNKLNAIINATVKDMKKAETALLRMTDDIYRQTMYKAQMFYNTGAKSMYQCIDMATKDFLNAGINCVQYKNGARVNIASYAEMSLRTSNKRANLMGQANTREKWGIHTVKVNARGIACPMCLQWLDKVYIDDVYGGGTAEESAKSGYPLLSIAVQGGLYHPNCKDSCSTYYEGISREPQEITDNQKKETLRRYNLEQKQRYYERNYKRNIRLANGCLDAKNAQKYRDRANQCKNNLINLCKNNSDVLRLDKNRLSLNGVLSVDNVGRLSVTHKANKNANMGQLRAYNSELAKGIGKQHFDNVQDLLDNCADSDIVSMFRAYERKIKVGSTTKNSAYALGDTIYLHMDNVAKGDTISKAYQTFFHETGHTIDTMSRDKLKTVGVFARHYSGAYKNGLFPNTIKEEVQDLVKKRDKSLKQAFKDNAKNVDWFYKNGYISKWKYQYYKDGSLSLEDVIPKYKKSYAYSSIEKEMRSYDKKAVADLCDILEGATNAKISCVAGHGKKYWADRTVGGVADGLATEAFAEITSSVIANKESLKMIKKYLPKTYEVYKEIVKEILKNG